MSGIEVLVLVGAGIYITKKVKDSRERKRLEKQAAYNAEHGIPQIVEPTTPTRKVVEEEEALPLYMPPEKDSETLQGQPGQEGLGESSTAGIMRNQVAVEGEDVDAAPPPSYDELSPSASTGSGLFPQQSSQSSQTPANDLSIAEKKSRRLSRPKFSFHRSSKSQTAVQA